MTAYYVLGITFVVFALVLSALGLTRDGFPPSVPAGRALMAVGGLIAVITFGVLLASTEREHPREEAAEKAAEKKAEEAAKGAPGEQPAGGEPGGGAVKVVEKEYSIELADGATLKPGKVTFEVANEGKIQHDLAVQDGGQEAKTPLIDAGKEAKLPVELKPAKYRLFCTVPGHAELGMDKEVTVGGA
jgi:uncharacterized cupredoxin-like copper-binding protein